MTTMAEDKSDLFALRTVHRETPFGSWTRASARCQVAKWRRSTTQKPGQSRRNLANGRMIVFANAVSAKLRRMFPK